MCFVYQIGNVFSVGPIQIKILKLMLTRFKSEDDR